MSEPFDPTLYGRGEPPLSGGAIIPMARPVALTDLAGPSDRQHPILLAGTPRGRAWVDLLVALFLVAGLELFSQLVVYGLLMLVVGDAPDEVIGEESFQRMAQIPLLAFRAAAVMVVVIAMLRWRGQSARSVGVGSGNWLADVGLGIAATPAAYLLIVAWQFLTMAVWPGLYDQMVENADRILELIPKMHPMALGGVALVVGIYEELLFRGWLMTRLRRGTNNWLVAVVLSTLVFTGLHALDQTVGAMGPITILSLLFSLLVIWRRSIVPAIVAHFLFNYSQFIGLYWLAGEQWA